MATAQYLNTPDPTLVDSSSVFVTTFTDSSQQAAVNSATLLSEAAYTKATTLFRPDNMPSNAINNTANNAAAMPTSTTPQGEAFRFPTPFQHDVDRDHSFLLTINWKDEDLRAALFRSWNRTIAAVDNGELRPEPGSGIIDIKHEIKDLFSGQADRETEKDVAEKADKAEKEEAERLERVAEEEAQRAEEAQRTELDEGAFALANPTSPTYAPRSPALLDDPWTPRYDPVSPGTPLPPPNRQESTPSAPVSDHQVRPFSVKDRSERSFDSVSPFLLPARLLGRIVGQIPAPKRVHETMALDVAEWRDDRTWYPERTGTPYQPMSPRFVPDSPNNDPISPAAPPDSPGYMPASPNNAPISPSPLSDSPRYVPASPNKRPTLPSIRTILHTPWISGLTRPTVGMASSPIVAVPSRQVEASDEVVGEEYRPRKRKRGEDGEVVAVGSER